MPERRLRVLLPFGVLGVGVLLALLLWVSGPAVSTQPPEAQRPVVRVVETTRAPHRFVVRTHGTVAPRTESELIPEVSGPVVWVSPALVSGGAFEAGDVLLRIDPLDYEVALESARASLQRTRSEHARAEKELERRSRLAERSAASESQLDGASNAERVSGAALREARAGLRRATRDVERTELRAPYAGRVREERVDVGQFVNRGSSVARIYAIDFAEVRLPVPDRELAYMKLPGVFRDHDSLDRELPVLLSAHFGGADHTWRGRVVRTEGEIDPKSRMVHVVARVDDPYGRDGPADRPPLAVGLFVEAEILGDLVEDAIVLPRAALRTPDSVLVVDAEDRLRYRSVDVLRVERDQVVIRAGLEAGERVCISMLSSVVDGMEVRPVEAEASL